MIRKNKIFLVIAAHPNDEVTSTGVFLTKEYLKGLALGSLIPQEQSEEPSLIYKRVMPEGSEIKPLSQS